ncbi:MAG: hypothetical protein AAGA68_08290 [Pseudomonadota bacterium]
MRRNPAWWGCLAACGLSLGVGGQALAAVDVDVQLSANPAQTSEQVIVSIAVSNPGTSLETDLRVTTPYPAGVNNLSESLVLGGLSVSESCAQANDGNSSSCSEGDLLIWNLAPLAPGAATILSFPVTVSAGAFEGSAIPWVAEVTEFGVVRSSDDASIIVDGNAVASLTIAEDQDPVGAGELLTYTVDYGNPSVTNFNDAVLTVDVPAGTTVVSASGGAVVDGNEVSWSFGNLPAGFVGRERVSVAVDTGLAPGTLLPVDGEFAGTSNFLPSTRTTREIAYVNNGGPLALSVNINASPAQPSEQVLVSLNLANTANFPVFDAQVLLRYPGRLFNLSESLTVGGLNVSASCAQANDGNSSSCSINDLLIFDFDQLNPGQSIELSFPVTVGSSAPSGTLIDWEARISEANGSLAWESVTLPVDGNAVASLSIDEDRDPIPAGEVLTYTLNYGNPSTTSFNDTQLALTLPPGTTLLTASGNFMVNGDEISWDFGDLPTGFVGRETLSVTVDAGLTAGTLLAVNGELTGTSNFLPSVRRIRETAYVNDGGPLALTVNVNPAPAQPNEQVLISLNLANTSNSPVLDAQVLVRYPGGIFNLSESLTLGGLNVSASCAQANDGNSSSCSINDLLIWDFDQLNPGQSIELSFPVTVGSSAPSGALIDWEARVTEANGSRAWESTTLAVDANAVASLAIDEDQDPIAAGELMTYTLTYGNPSVTSLNDAQLTFTLPAAVTLVALSDGAMVNGDEVSWNFGDLPTGFVGQESVTVMVDAGLAPGTLLAANGELQGTSNFQPSVRRIRETAYVNDGGPLALSMNVNPSPATPGEQVLVSLNLTNTSNSPVLDAEVLVRYPERLFSLSEALTLGGLNVGSSCAQANDGNSSSCSVNDLLIWNFDQLNPGQSVELSFPVTVGTGAPSGALVDWEARITEANGSRAWESTTLAVDSNAVAALSIDESADPAAPGQVVSYAVRYGNPSQSGISDASLTLTLPSNVIFLGATDGGVLAGTRVRWELGDLPVNSIGQRVVQVRVRNVAEAGDLLVVGATLEGTSGFAPTVRRVRETGYVSSPLPLAVRFAVNPLPALPGQQTNVVAVVDNFTNNTILDAQLVIRYPQRLNNLNEAEATGGIDTGASCAQANDGNSSSCSANDFLIWNIDSIDPGEQLTVSLPPFVSLGTSEGSIVDWRLRVTEATGTESWHVVRLPVGADSDADADGIGNAYDNCTFVSNTDQRDSNGDGFGNLCDGDFNGDLLTTGIDFFLFRNEIQSTDSPDQDLDGDGIVTGADFVIFRGLLGQPPGPSEIVP